MATSPVYQVSKVLESHSFAVIENEGKHSQKYPTLLKLSSLFCQNNTLKSIFKCTVSISLLRFPRFSFAFKLMNIN